MGTRPHVAPDCTTGMTWPVVDGAVATLTTLLLFAALTGKHKASEKDVDSREIAAGVLLAGTTGVAALIGYSRVTRCRSAHAAFAAPPVAVPAGRAPALPAAKPQPDSSLGTQGDVCATQAECAGGFTCTGNVCLN